MTYGIVIIALGYDIYGDNAYNLAVSLKANDERIRVCLLYEPTATKKLTPGELAFFDQKILIPESEYTLNGKKQFQRAKLLAYKYSPFDYTMYLDADNIWVPNKKPSWLMGEMMASPFTIGCNGGYNPITDQKQTFSVQPYTFWGEPKLTCEYFKIKNYFPQTVSGFYCFHKCEIAEKIFNKALEVYDDINAPTIQWANGKADEYCFNVALAYLNYPQPPLNILYFDKLSGKKEGDFIYKNFWGIAMGGHKVSDFLIILYNKLVNMYSIKMKMGSRYYHRNKLQVIPERDKF